MGRKKTHEEFMRDFYKKNSNAENIEILGEYKGNQIKIKCKCLKDGYTWEARPNDLLSKNSGCPKCGIEKVKNSRKLTHEEFLEKFYKQNKNAENIEILGEYVKNNIKIKVRCKICKNEWEVIPHDLLAGYGCPKCANKKKSENNTLTHEEFLEKFYKQNKNAENIEILGEYVNAQTKIKCKCKLDGYTWETKAYHLLNGTGCPKCSGIMQLTHEEFINRIKDINNDIEVLEKYVNMTTKIKVRCKIDNNIWYVTPGNLLSGYGCPKCNASKGEKRIAKYLDNRNIKYIHDKGYFKDLKNSKNNILRPDFIIKDRKIWIEFDGKQHFEVVDFSSKNQELAKEQFEQIKENDKIKNEYAKKHNWKLIRIPYTEYDNIEKILEKELEGV